MKITNTPEQLGFSSQRLERIKPGMQGYIDRGEIAGIITLIARRGSVVQLEKFGYQDLASRTPMSLDTIFRLYSMTKPITSVALMMLFERGLVRLTDPVSKFIPAFKDLKVWAGEGELAELEREVTVQDLLRHTSGLSYGGYEETKIPVDKLYDQADLYDTTMTLEEMVRRITDLPLACQPGQKWIYSVSTDVVGRLVEVIADMSLADFIEEKICQPLGMVDTAFSVPPDKVERLATLYGPTAAGPLQELDAATFGDFFNARLYSGGAGLVSTTPDYLRFAQMCLNQGELDGVRLLGPRTVQLMRSNHLPPALLPIVMEPVPMPGLGFGLGFSVVLDVPQLGSTSSVGAYGWGGWASTNFWVDPQEQLLGLLMLQYIPTSTHPIRDNFRTLVYQALID